MIRAHRLLKVLLIAATSLSSFAFPAAPSRIFLITVDTLRADRLGCYGNQSVPTPHVDRLAADGILFKNAVAQVPLTLPSHSSILTGTHPVFHGVRDQTGFFLAPQHQTLAEILKGRGYSTAAFVSSVVLDSRYGLNQGFDHYFDDFDSSRSASSSLERKGEETLSAALSWLNQARSDQVFVWIHFYDPHAPYAAPEPWKTRFARQPYDGEVAYVDSLVGKFLNFLEERDWYRSSVIVLASDHGEDLGDHGENTHGLFVYDSTVRIPLIIKAGLQRKGVKISDQVQSVDIAPTLLQLLSVPVDAQMQGRSLLSLMLQKSARPAPAFGESHYPYHHFRWSPLYFYRTEKWKYIEAPAPELYDLERDPRETHNLYQTQRSLANQLKNQLSNLQQRFQSKNRNVSVSRVDAETLEKLKSLGYIGYAAPRLPASAAGLPDPKQKLEVYIRFQDALLDEQNDRLQQAARKLKEVAGLDPELIDVYIHLGLIYKRLRQYPQAIEQFKQALRYDSENSIATYNLAHSYALAGLSEEAVVGFQRTLQLDPNESRAHVGLGIAFQLKGRWEEAISQYEQALEINPTDSLALSNLGAAFLSQGRIDEALSSLRRALEIRPSASVHQLMGQALSAKGMHSEAEIHFRRAAELQK